MIVSDHDLLIFALLGLHRSWKGFPDVVSGRENVPNWERFWTDYIQEEIPRGTIEERSVTLWMRRTLPDLAQACMAKGKKSQGEVESSQKGKKKDLSKIKFFHYHEFGHYDTNCPKRKKCPIRIMYLHQCR